MPLHPYFVDFFAQLVPRLEAGMTIPQALQEASKQQKEYQVPADIETQDLSFPGPHGDIPVRMYRPVNHSGLKPALVWFHGGGFVMGSIDQKEAHVVAAEVAHLASCIVVSVDYRLVTKVVKFPVPLDDGYFATTWVHVNATELGIDPTRLFVGGASAGGSLAATVCMRATQHNLPIRGAALAYPLTHLELPEISSELAEKITHLPSQLVMGAEYVKNRNAFLLPEGSLELNHFGWPGEEPSLHGFPPTLVIEAEYDAIRASSESLIKKLQSQGVAVQSHLASGMTHGFLNHTPSEVDYVARIHALIADFVTQG
jgi:acetyl esterase/lipase